MRKKIFTFLLALAASVGMMNAAVDGKLPGAFSVSDTKVVYFSQGNLQATTTDYGQTWTWAFAEHQWDYIGGQRVGVLGTDDVRTGNNFLNVDGTTTDNGTVDLFTWVGESSSWTGSRQYGLTSAYTAYEKKADGYGTVKGEALKSDWGTMMGSDWRTLTKDEWTYLFNTRTGTSASTVGETADVRYACATVNSIVGAILFPDGVTFATSEFTTVGSFNTTTNFGATTCTAEQWSNLEEKGCVFLAPGGYRYLEDPRIYYAGEIGYYWSSTSNANNAGAAHLAKVDARSPIVTVPNNNSRYYGYSVRLVSDTPPSGGSTPTPANPVIKLNANFSGEWADTEAFTDNGDGTATLSVTTLTAGSWYNFGVKVDDTWVSDNAAFSRDEPSRAISGNGDAMWFQADLAGTYTFTWAYESNTLTIGYPSEAPTPTPSGDKLPGAFTVDNTGKQVNFSKGNVQYVGGSWKFADNQWDMIGNAQANDNRDLFGWGTGSEPNKTTEYEPYYTTFTDWGTNFGEGWRTMTKDEWIYLLETRDNAANLRTLATVNSVKGLILMPDGWTASGVALAVTIVNYTSNMINESNWATLASQGCVFLPAAGYRVGNEVSDVGSGGYYFSSTNHSDNHAAHMSFETYTVTGDQYTFAYCGNSVRLVTDAGGSTPTPSIPTVGMKGSWDDWADVVNFTDNGDGTASATKSFDHEGYYTFKTVLDGDDWRGNGEAFKRDYTGATSITGNTDMTLWIDAKGEYTFTWTYATNAIGIAYPTLPTIQTKGSWDNWTDALNFTDNGDGTASVTKHFDAEGYHDFKINVGADDWRGNGETFKRDYTGAQWINENGSDMKLYVDEPGDYTFTWSYVENALSIALPAQSAREVVTNGDPQDPTYYYSTFYHSANKYALPEDVEAFVADLSGSDLVLTKIAVTGQTIPSNTAVILRRANSPEEIQLIPSNAEAVTFTTHNSLQGVDMATAAPANCYILSGTSEYGVGFYRINSSTLKAHKAYVIYTGSAAPKRMRFVFNQEQVVTGIDNANADIKAEKRIENGQLIIIKNNVRYNAAGQIVK